MTELVAVLAVVAVVQWRKADHWRRKQATYREILRIFSERPDPYPTGPGTPLRLVS